MEFSAEVTNEGATSCVVHDGEDTVGYFVYKTGQDVLVWDSAGPLSNVVGEAPYDYEDVAAGASVNAPISGQWSQQQCSESSCDGGTAVGAGTYEVEVVWGDVGIVGSTFTIG
jgi:hypothetical protein